MSGICAELSLSLSPTLDSQNKRLLFDQPCLPVFLIFLVIIIHNNMLVVCLIIIMRKLNYVAYMHISAIEVRPLFCISVAMLSGT